MKIARGKVKDDEKYTCPICDWRVKIPRDAARPKLEDLQAWQEEIPGLPFQPDEEEILAKIIDNAQEFRQHVSPFCNPLMATADEAETQRFYLRKIEGSEILLAYETNFFRQELHKWSPVAPEPPPILQASKSTRKPRPTKLQKLMAQHGVDDPENLPQGLRTKTHAFKPKSVEPQQGRHQPLQPAPGRSDSGTPTSHSFPTTASMNPHGHPGPSMHDPPPHMHPTHYGGFAGVQDQHYMSSTSRESPREAFAAHAFLQGLPSPSFDSAHSPRGPAIFNERAFGDVAIGGVGGIGSPMRESFGPSQGVGSQEVAQMFDHFTNQDEDDSQGQKNNKSLVDPALGLGLVAGGNGIGIGGVKKDDRDGQRDGARDGADAKWGTDEDLDMFFNAP